ncbi:MAG: hypothetical protein IKB86_05780 [Clostridia bacterium]|nr:hypothetical protein [Clostridia bacterium]
MNLSDFSKHILCPKNKVCYPTLVKHTFGDVTGAENILGASGTTTLTYSSDTAPKLILDLGESSVGGYPVFKIKSYTGEKPVIRLAYADWYDYIMDETYGENGDFRRGCCKYLGVELPVLPGDPNRFNLFTISREGEYISPLVQGQERWLMIKLETPGTSVEIEYAYIYYTSDDSAYDGGFECSNPDLTKLWYASCWTCQIATINNSHAWDNLNSTLLLRTLAKGNDAGYYKDGVSLTDYVMEFDGAISRNPQMCSGIGVLLRATDITSGYVIFVNLDGTVQAFVRKNNTYFVLTTKKLDFEVIDNKFYHFTASAKGNVITLSIDGNNVLEFTNDTYPVGSFGFCQTTEKFAVAKNLTVSNDEGVIWKDDFSKNLDAYEFTRSKPFVSDGAKRDRLPWIGDLDWAGRNIYYAFRNFTPMPETLRMFAFHQTSEGFVWGTCYPENTQKPEEKDYGYYESDIFSAWIVPTLADYLLFTGDKDFCRELYPTIKADVDYLWRFVESDGLFNQRYATSKGLWDHTLNDMGKFTYNNLIISEAFGEAAYIAKELGLEDDAKEFSMRKETVRKAIRENFTSPEGYLTKSLTNRDFCEMSNAMALSLAYFDDRNHAAAALEALLNRTPGHGKTTTLMIRGAYMYDFDVEAISTLIQPGYRYVHEGAEFVAFDPLYNPNFDFASLHIHPANWVKALNDWRGPATTWECMTYPPFKDSKGEAWGDRSHPDTAVAHILTAYMLGVMPEKPGFKTFTVAPHTALLDYAKGIIPSKFGDIFASWKKENDVLTLSVDFAGENELAGIKLKADDAKTFVVTVNGKKASQKSNDGEYIYF